MSVLLDLMLALLAAGLAVRLLLTREAFEAVVLFVAFGLALTLVWVRLGAVDVALAEAALGAGVTGALLVNTLRRLELETPDWLRPREGGALGVAGAAACAAAAGAAGVLAIRSPRAAEPLGAVVAGPLSRTGLESPVTGVLLDLRAYDTLLEVAVLMAAMVAVWALERGRPAVPLRVTAVEEPVLAAMVRRIVPLTVMTAVYLAWVGSYAPGGAFQAGSLLAGSAVLLMAAGLIRPYPRRALTARVLVAGGLIAFTLAALVTGALTGSMLRWTAGAGPVWILTLEAVLTVSIAAVLAELFVDVPAEPVERGP
jgi:multisubunit Na+/H+ antiporter MnhB subunit